MSFMIDGLNMLQVLHPMVVHFPIAFLTAAVLFEILWMVKGSETHRTVSTWMVYLGAAGAVVAVGAGYLAAGILGHDAPGHELVHEHRNIMLILTLGLVATALALRLSSSFRRGAGRRALVGALILLAGIMAYGADKGGRLVYLYGAGVAIHEPGTAMNEHGGSGHHNDHDTGSDHHH